MWKKASHCGSGSLELNHINGTNESHQSRPSISHGTQRLYIRLNTIYYLLTQIHSLEKTLSQNPCIVPSICHPCGNHHMNHSNSDLHFNVFNSSMLATCQHVSEVAANRLIFHDSNSVFYDSLYVGGVSNARIRPALRILKQNIEFMTLFLSDRAQSLAMKEVMKATFDAFLMVLLAGGNSRVFKKSDNQMIKEDFETLIRVFCACGEGLIEESVVEREAEVVEGIIALMEQSTEQLVADFNSASCETSGVGINGQGNKIPIPPISGKWNRSDPNTILRVLCHKNDRAANLFLKRTFRLGKR